MAQIHEIPLHFAAEFALAVESDAYPKTDNSTLQFRGPLDEDKLADSFREAAMRAPLTRSIIRQKRVGLGYRLFWVPQSEPAELKVHDCRDRFAEIGDPVEFVQDFFAHRTLKRLDLFSEYPIQFNLIRIEDERYLLGMLYHHISMDAATGYVLLRNMLAGYHKRVTGRMPEWGTVNAIGSQIGRNEIAPCQPLSGFLREQIAEIYLRSRDVSQVKTAATRELLGRYNHRAIFESRSVVPAMKAIAKRNQATIGDVIGATISRAIGRWDRDHGEQTRDQIRALLAVNIRGRVPEDESKGVALSGLMIKTRRPEEMSLDEVVRRFRETRAYQLRVGTDVAYHKMLETISRATSMLPFSLRGPIARFSLQVPVTYILSNIGVMWPQVVDGRLTGRSAIDNAGGVVVDDVHSCPSMSPVVGIGIITRTLGENLFVNYSSDRFRFTREEAGDLTGRISDAIVDLGRMADADAAPARVAS